METVYSNSKLKNLAHEDLETMWRFRYPEDGGTKLSYEAILVEIPKLFGFSSSLGALSEFYRWLKLRRRMEAAKERADQVKLELAKNGELDADELERVAQTVFTSEAMEGGDAKTYVALATLRLNKRRTELEERRIKLLEERAAEAKAKLEAIANAAKSTGGLTPETLAAIEEAAGLL